MRSTTPPDDRSATRPLVVAGCLTGALLGGVEPVAASTDPPSFADSLGAAAAQYAASLTVDELQLVVDTTDGGLRVAPARYSMKLARYAQMAAEPWVEPTGVGATATLLTADERVVFARRSPRCRTGGGQIVAACGEAATPADVDAGFWDPRRTLRRGLAEELGVTIEELDELAAVFVLDAGTGDLDAVFAVATTMTFAELVDVAAAAPDAWERTSLLGVAVGDLAAAAAAFDWAPWGLAALWVATAALRARS